MLEISYAPYTLKFREPAGTSRGILLEKPTFFIRIEDSESGRIGFGEIPVFPGLSRESVDEVKETLNHIKEFPESLSQQIGKMSSVTFGIETALKDLENCGNGLIFPSSFTQRETTIEINGLIWMGDFKTMLSRLDEKLEQGFRCIKIKIGAIQWEKELDLMRLIRQRCGEKVSIRVDANGAFNADNCLNYMEQLARYDVHSIEQPIPPGNYKAMKEICRYSPIPVALDEELNGLPIGERRQVMLEEIYPRYIILKPALCYGFSGMSDWIHRAEKMGIGWWITSALESSIGLNAIAQYAGQFPLSMPQGLGTGQLYTNNLISSVALEGDKMEYIGFPELKYHQELQNLNWI